MVRTVELTSGLETVMPMEVIWATLGAGSSKAQAWGGRPHIMGLSPALRRLSRRVIRGSYEFKPSPSHTEPKTV